MTRAPRPAKRPDYAVLASAFIFDLILYLGLLYMAFGKAY